MSWLEQDALLSIKHLFQLQECLPKWRQRFFKNGFKHPGFFVKKLKLSCTQEDSGVASPHVYSGGLCRILPGRILTCGHTYSVHDVVGSYYLPDSVIGTVCVLWPDSAVEHVGGLCRYSDRKSCVRVGAFNLIHTTCVRYISCICIYLGNFVFVLGCFFVFFFYSWIFSLFLSLFDVSFFFFNGQRFLMAEGVKTYQKTIIKLLFFISINGKKP